MNKKIKKGNLTTRPDFPFYLTVINTGSLVAHVHK